jgi:hypothetical protein
METLEETAATVNCMEIKEVRTFLRNARKDVDNLQYALNLTGASVRQADRLSCSEIWTNLQKTRDVRESIIGRCIQETDRHITFLKSKGYTGPNRDIELQSAEYHSRLLRAELQTEESIRKLSTESFKLKCRQDYLKILGDMSHH